MADSVAGTAEKGHAADGDVVGVVLAAGEGRRLRPLTDELPKPLCPVGNLALIDLALDRLAAVTADRAVNLHHGRAAIEQHLESRRDASSIHRSVEEPVALGTAGALGRLRGWIDGRAALVVNADSWTDADLVELVRGWDGAQVRLLITRAPGDATRPDAPAVFGPRMGLVASLLPWREVRELAAEPSGLYETMWSPANWAGRLETVEHRGRFVDCGTPADYLRANLEAVAVAGGSIVAPDARVATGARVVEAVIGSGAVLDGSVERSVVWTGAEVTTGEHLVGVVRTPRTTVSV
jgi:MurNAc alpha-1-phosphate uridylyltransferase